MADAQALIRRKDEHLDLALAQQGRGGRSPFDAVRFQPCALPELDLAEVSIATRFLDRDLPAPLLISSMTGGPARGGEINRNLSLACEATGTPLAVGSQRVALETDAAAGLTDLRRHAPSILLIANLGAAQLLDGHGVEVARRAVGMIGADALFVHLNPLQEAVQGGGDVDWRGVLAAIATLVRELDAPVLVKEVGFGLSADAARRLIEVGVAALDVAGSGGTDWAAIETDRAGEDTDRQVGEPFGGWGLTTPEALVQVRAACPEAVLIGSGGVRHGLDAARAIRLGADMVGQAGPVLAAAMRSADAVVEHIEVFRRQLAIASFATGSADLAALKQAPLIA